MRQNRILKTMAIVLIVLVCLGGLEYGAILWQIHDSVQNCISIAQAHHPHPGDDIASLIVYMQSKEHSLRERNLAVWTLGRLQNPKALPALKSFYTGNECSHDTQLCQYELSKAIKLCGGVL